MGGVSWATATRSLYRGVLPPLLTTGLVQSVQFSTYEMAKRRFLAMQDAKQRSRGQYLACVFAGGSCGGLLVTAITVPVSVVKLQQQLASERGMFACAKALVAKHGWSVLYRGLLPGLIMEIGGRGVYICTYETVKLAQLDEVTRAEAIAGKDPVTGLRVKMIAAACAGTTGWMSVYAVDVTKSRMMLDAGGEVFPTWWSCVRDTWREGGIRRMYRGVGFSLIRAAPVAATVLPIYELTRGWLYRTISALEGTA